MDIFKEINYSTQVATIQWEWKKNQTYEIQMKKFWTETGLTFKKIKENFKLLAFVSKSNSFKGSVDVEDSIIENKPKFWWLISRYSLISERTWILIENCFVNRSRIFEI